MLLVDAMQLPLHDRCALGLFSEKNTNLKKKTYLEVSVLVYKQAHSIV